MITSLNELSEVYLNRIVEQEQTPEALKQRVSQMVKAIRYRARKEAVPISKAFNDYIGSVNATSVERQYVKERLGLTGGTQHKEEVEVPTGNIAKLARKASSRIDSDVSGSIDKKDSSDKTMGVFIPSPDGKRKIYGTKVKESFSNWRQELVEVMDEIEGEKQIKEKKVKNKVVINPVMKEEIEELGGRIIEMVEIDEVDYIIESVYDELIEEGYEEDEVEGAIEYALTEAKVTFGHDTATTANTEKKKKSLLDTARKKLSGAKTAAKAAVARGARKVAKGALGVARKMEGGDKTPKSTERKPSTYRGAGAGQKERVSSGSYTAPTKKKAEKPADPWKGSATVPQKPKPKPKAEKPADPWEGSATTPAKSKAKTKKAAAPAAKTTSKPKRKRKSKLDDLLASVRNEEIQLDEKALSKQQQKFMGMVYAVKKGDMKAPSPEVAKAAAGMTTKQAKDFAKTKHKGLPEVKEQMDDPMGMQNGQEDDKRMKQEREKIKRQRMKELMTRLQAARKGVY